MIRVDLDQAAGEMVRLVKDGVNLVRFQILIPPYPRDNISRSELRRLKEDRERRYQRALGNRIRLRSEERFRGLPDTYRKTVLVPISDLIDDDRVGYGGKVPLFDGVHKYPGEELITERRRLIAGDRTAIALLAIIPNHKTADDWGYLYELWIRDNLARGGRNSQKFKERIEDGVATGLLPRQMEREFQVIHQFPKKIGNDS